MRVRCRLCFKEIAPIRRCFGHGGGGGDGSGSGSSAEKKARFDEGKILTQSEKSVEDREEFIGEFDSIGGRGGLESFSDEKSFDPEIIAELIAKGLLVIDDDRESMTLTIKLQCEPKLLTEQQRDALKKYMEAVLREFNEFKEENHLAEDCVQFIQDEEGNITSLRITMPTLALYDAFIQRLANNLLPTANPKLQENDESKNEQGFAPNPLSMKPKLPSREERECIKDIGTKKTEDMVEEIFNPSPFKMKPW